MPLTAPAQFATPQTTPTTAPEDTAADTAFRYRRVVILLLLVLWTLALFSFHPEDIDFYAGGLTGSIYPRNMIGAAGACLGWTTFVALGLAAYPAIILTLVCSVRRLIYRRGLRRSSWAYFAAIALFAAGCSFALGLFPDSFAGATTALNIGKFPGGVVGQKFCAPGAGWLQMLMNTTGALIVAIAMMGTALGIVWHYDWRRMTVKALERLMEKWRQERALQAQETALDAQGAAPLQGYAMESSTDDAPRQSLVSMAEGAPTLVTPAPGQRSFATRRGSVQSPGEPRDYAPRVNTPPAPRQQELPQQPAPAPQPQTQPTAAAPRPATPPPTIRENEEDGEAYRLPGVELFTNGAPTGGEVASHDEIERNSRTLQDTLDQFKVDATVVNAIPGPQVTLFEVELAPGILTNAISRIQSNISMSLATPQPVRLLLPIPGKNLTGVEVANKHRQIVTAQEVFNDPAWVNTRCAIPLMLGRDVNGKCIVIDLAKAPHLLVAGSTGSGKSGVMNLMIQSLLLRFSPDDLNLIMFDPKYLEFQPYSTLPHLISRIINEPKQVGLVLRWACNEMNRRYVLLSKARVKKLAEFNTRPMDPPDMTDDEGNPLPRKLPYIVIIIDELADIMAAAKKEVEAALQVLAAKSRAAGIHMIVATQRPDAHVVTGTLKNNFPWRIALQVTDAISSNVVMGQKGAESLLGQGDMLFRGDGALNRIQGGWVTNEEIATVVEACSSQRPQIFDASLELALKGENGLDGEGGEGGETTEGGDEAAGDDLVSRAVAVIKETKRPTISLMQRRLRIGYNKAADLIQELEDLGYIGPEPISGLREIYWDNLPSSRNATDRMTLDQPEDEEDMDVASSDGIDNGTTEPPSAEEDGL